MSSVHELYELSYPELLLVRETQHLLTSTLLQYWLSRKLKMIQWIDGPNVTRGEQGQTNYVTI